MEEARRQDREWEEPQDEDNGDESQYTTNTEQDKSQQSVLLELEDEDATDQPLGADERLDRLSAEDNAEAVLNDMSDFTDDQEILDDFAERQMMPTDEQGLMRRMRQHHSESPEQTAGDVDAAWDQAEDAGDETPSAEPMPDHDRVDEIGEALGVTYEDDEELDFAAKVWQRDEDRFELDPESAEDQIDQVEDFPDDDVEDQIAEAQEAAEDDDEFLDESL